MEELFNTNSSTIRFLGILKQPATTTTNNHHPSPPPPPPDSFPFELDESDVIWSSSSPCASSSPDLPKTTATDFIVTESNSSPRTESTLSNSSPRNSFRNDKFGLTAALSEDNIHANNNHLQRKRSLNSPLSAASTAVRMIPPIPIQRSSFGSGGGSGSGGGGGNFLGPSSLGKYPYNQSAPVNVPVWPNRNHRSGSGGNKKVFYDENDDGDDDDESYAEMLPPHEIVARSHLTTFSVFEGVGRTLKGRDLRRVRNAVMQKTGFLD